MSLDEYAAKRRFEKTPEPPPSATKGTPAAKPFFCVQRHDATRLHYDFRLEIDGVLKSWAVPKGPSLDPGVKVFAAHVEDHPMEYGDFEGNIPAGNYGGGSVMLWDRGTFDLLGDTAAEAQLARGDLKFRLHGEKLKGDFAIVLMKGRGKGNEWLLIKKRDEFATTGWDVEALAHSVLSGRTQEEIARNLPARQTKRDTAGAADRVWATSPPAKRARARMKKPLPDGRGSDQSRDRQGAVSSRSETASAKRSATYDLAKLKGAQLAEMPAAIEPMKAMLADRVPRGEDWLFEVKWDGVRAVAFLDNEEVRLQSRSGLRCERQYPELAVMPHHIAASQAVIDGEIAVLDAKGVSQFHLIQPRIANTDPNTIAHLVRSTPVIYFAFDLLYLNGYDLRGVALDKRRELLRQVLTPGPSIRISDTFPGAGEELLEAARENGLEGIVAKHARSTYESRRSREWLKIKIVGEQEFVIGGFTEPQGDRDYFGALVLGVHKDGELRWVGNVGTGFDQKLLAGLYARLQPLIAPDCPFSARPKPDRGITWVKPELVCQVKYANWTPDDRLRAPVFVGLRNDVEAPGVVRDIVLRAVPEPAGELLPGSPKEATLPICGHTLKFTNLAKLYYPGEGVTKRDVLNYYAAVADLILPHLQDRPLSLKRYPNGIREQFFFQKDTPDSYPGWLRTERIDEINYVFASDRASLLYLVNLGCIDQNPAMSRLGSLEHPDFILVDLDPQECAYDLIVEAALLVKRILDQIGLVGYPKTTGGDGMHVYIPIEPVYSFEEARTFAELIARLATHERPHLFTTPRMVAKRQKNRVYFDHLQIGKSKTIAAPYVLRAYEGAPVATPLEWAEVVPGLHPKQFHIHNARERFRRKGDLFLADLQPGQSIVLERPQNLYEALGHLEKLFR
ncbi:MAG: DNA ligase D [Candidatus Solibacter sp.]|nr:DNA ligase D [Candidatus Solibacter sp.]